MTDIRALLNNATTGAALNLAWRWCEGRRIGEDEALAHALRVVEVLHRHIPDVAPEVVAAAAVQLHSEHLDNGALLVHSYGHGGAGVTLSWGCATTSPTEQPDSFRAVLSSAQYSSAEVNVAGLAVSLGGAGGVLEVGLCLDLAGGAAILVGLANG